MNNLVAKHPDDCATHTGGACNCYQSNMPVSFNIRDALSKYVNCAFEHEDEFLNTYCRDMKAVDLLECYMGADRCKIIFLLESGTTISNTISTTKFMAWCDGKFNTSNISDM